ncbi:MAG: flagellar filament capping protein FliD [bacterium]|jgi:flagellar capping protein FliD|nr:flagellar filament capping protein FliD [candidate division KSB1 bacterium]MDH7559306.1 flagellar filament capping protein FliD [bacterium]
MISLDALFNQSSAIDALVEKYMALERKPVTELENRKSTLNVRVAMYQDLKNYLTSLKALVDDLAESSSDSIFNLVNVVSSNAALVSATVSSGAATGTYQLRVRQLATATTVKSSAALNTAAGVVSSAQVVPGPGELDTSESWSAAGFTQTPDGSVTINGKEFVLADYATVDAFMAAVNQDETAGANIYYDSLRDRFVIESDETGVDLVVSESPETYGFLTAGKIVPGTYTTNRTGVQADVFLYQANFDKAVGEDESGSFKINGVTITWDADTDTLNTIIGRINRSAAGVTAYYDDTLDKLVLTANQTGSDEIALEDVTGTFLTQTLKLAGATQTLGQDARFTINSTSAEDEITKDSNTFSINGITYVLRGVTVANDDYADPATTAVTITASKDTSTLEAKIRAFLSSLNTVTSYIKAKSAVDSSTYTRGAMTGETVFTSLRTQLLGALLGRVTGLESGKPSTVAEIGITVDSALQASLSDASKLRAWLQEDPVAVENLFNSSDGVATRMASLLEAFTDTGGIVDDQQTNLREEVRRIDNRLARLNEQLQRREEYYRKQLASMQEALYALVQQQSTLAGFLNSFSSWNSG